MKIWVDADACPAVIKDILFRAAKRTRVPVTLVANHAMKIPSSEFITFLLVQSGFDVADNEIIKRMRSKDLVVTGDIPLAAEVIERDGYVLSPRGQIFDRENIRGRLNMRDFMDTLRSSGIQTGGPAALTSADKQNFANCLDQLLNRWQRETSGK